MFAEKSDKLLQTFSFKTEIKTEVTNWNKDKKISSWVLQSGHFVTLKQIRN